MTFKEFKMNLEIAHKETTSETRKQITKLIKAYQKKFDCFGNLKNGKS